MSILSRLAVPAKLRSKKSFTLVELIFEIIVLSILVIPTAILLVQLTLDITETETNSIATALCVQKSEDILRGYTFATVDLVTLNGAFPTPYTSYSFNITVNCVNQDNLNATEACASTSNYKRAIVSVSQTGIPNPVVANLLFTKDVI